MHIAVIVNRVGELNDVMTTVILIRGAAERGHRVLVCEVGGFEVDEHGEVLLRGRWIGDPDLELGAWPKLEVERVPTEKLSAVLIRTNPARDRDRLWVHDVTLLFSQLVHDAGLPVLNDPHGLAAASNKLFLSRIPASCRPLTLVSRDPRKILEFVKDFGQAVVLKPLHGTHGRDVFRILPEEMGNLRQIIDVLARTDYVMVQEYLPEAPQGDTRVLLWKGEPLELGRHPAAVRRVPQGVDFRGNVSAGAVAEPAELTAGMRRAIDATRPILQHYGLYLVGVDFIGDRIVELNVFSPGGLHATEDFYGGDYAGALVDRVVEMARRV